jgi:hypothetical protein
MIEFLRVEASMWHINSPNPSLLVSSSLTLQRHFSKKSSAQVTGFFLSKSQNKGPNV